jgi:ABC-2 type transport system ATP-binding protein
MNADISQDCTGLATSPSVSAGITHAAGPILQIENLCVDYGNRGSRAPGKRAVDGLNLSVKQGEVFGFLGPNGAGKTTTMNVLLGFINATSGDAYLFGTTVREPIARQRIGYLPELTYYYKFLSAEELLRFYTRIFKIPSRSDNN